MAVAAAGRGVTALEEIRLLTDEEVATAVKAPEQTSGAE